MKRRHVESRKPSRDSRRKLPEAEGVSRTTTQPEVWIRRFDVKPRPSNECLDTAIGAFVNVLALALDAECFLRLVAEALEEHEFHVVHYEDIATMAEWTQFNRVHPELERLARELSVDCPVQFGEFQSYEFDDA